MGKSFKTLSSIDSLQIDSVLKRILRVKLIHSYELRKDSNFVCQRVFPLNPASITTKPLSLRVAFEESFSDNIPPGPLILEDGKLAKLAHRFWKELEMIRSLDETQIKDVLGRICDIRCLRLYYVWLVPATIDSDTLSSGLDKPTSSTNETPKRTNSEAESKLSNRAATEPSQQNTSDPTHSDKRSGITSEAPRTETVACLVSTSPAIIDGAEAYPTPLSDSTQPKRRTLSVSLPSPTRKKPRQREQTRGIIRSNPTAESLLKGCNFNGKYLGDDGIREVLKADAYLLPPDPQMLRHLSDQWHNNLSQGRHALGLPQEWIGVQAAWNYICELETGNLDPIAENVAYMLYHINYSEICQHPEKYCPRACKDVRRNQTWVLDCIIEAAYPDDRSRRLKGPQLRSKISNIYKRKAQWCGKSWRA
ncbi:hypothetical protein BJX62DRAFT_54672 [Aspergillus germanicus]